MRSILKNIILYESLGFTAVILFLWLSEFIYCFGSDVSCIRYEKKITESLIIFLNAFLIILITSRFAKKIVDIAMYDPLTGLMNRRHIYEYFEYLKSSSSKRCFSFVMCDLDHFKSVNDNFGHDCGDYVLKKTAEIIKNKLRPQDMVSRWGGEEFLIILPEMEKQGAFEVAERIRKEIFDYNFNFKEFEFSVSMSFGISNDYIKNINPFEVISKADNKLYEAKNTGRNKVVY